MKEIYKNYLFEKHILVSEHQEDVQIDAQEDAQKDPFAAAFAMASLLGIKITRGEKLLRKYMIKYAASRLGINVPEPFYKGFPGSVRQLCPDQLLFDQLVHYTVTYGFGDFSHAGHSLFEDQFERAAFKEDTDIKLFSVVTKDEAVSMLGEITTDLLAGTRPLSDEQYELVKSCIIDFHPEISNIASKNTCIRLLLDTQDLMFTEYIVLSDVIRLVAEMNYRKYGSKNFSKLNLRNQDRKFITQIIDLLISSGRCDLRTCYEKRKKWNGLLHHLHYKPETPYAKEFAAAMRSGANLSVYSAFEKAMKQQNIREAVDALKNGKGTAAVLRNLDYIISRCASAEELEYTAACINSENVIVMIQLLIRYAQYTPTARPRTFRFSRFNSLVVHEETLKETNMRRSVISVGQAQMLCAKTDENLRKALRNRLGRVYIDPDMKNYALPLQESTSRGGFGVLTRGSRIRIPRAKKIRAFTYWEKVDDIDLSVFGLDGSGNSMEFSWRTMAQSQSEAITYSGDETSGYNGGSEYFDIDMEKFAVQYPQVQYLVFCNNVFYGAAFSKCLCKAGYMTRDIEDSGEVFEPKTVKSSFTVDCDSKFAYLFGIDMKTNDLIWLNMARDSETRVAGTTGMDFLTAYFHVTDVINVYSFFEMMAAERVEDAAAAQVIVTDKDMEYAPGVTVIREYDVEKMMALMNKQHS